jgi:myotubularin-related protein 6/7/8
MNRNPQDEKLVAAIFATSKISITTFRSAPVTPMESRSTSDLSEIQDDTKSLDTPFTETEAEIVEDEAIKSAIPDEQENPEGPRVYGAQQKNLIVDARPTVNAYAQQVTGAGSENMEFYKPAAKAYLGIDNIHIMRKSLKAVVDTLKDSDITSFPPNREALASSGWLGHIANMMDGAGLIARTIGIQHSHVLIHCSDGWDRTSQLSALAQICLDPYYRTLDGFIVLIEKDWLSFGHMFRRRSGHLNSEKWFEIENERIATRQANLTSSTSGSGNAFENALSKAQGFFNKKNDKDSSESDPEGLDTPPPTSKHAKDDPFATQISETSPIFHQFLDATWQLLHQYPTRFEFNERFLRRLLYHLYSCQYGTFLYDNDRERMDNKAKDKTRSVWDYFLSRRHEFMNPNYDDEIDDHNPSKERLIFPKKDQVRWWAEVFGRSDKEMNGLAPGPVLKKEEVEQPTLVGVESAEKSVTVDAPPTATSSSNIVSSAPPPATSSSTTTTSEPTAEPAAAPPPLAVPDTDTDPLGAGVAFGSSVSEGKRSTQLNGLTRGLGRLGFGGGSGSASPGRSRTPQPVGSREEETGVEMK